MPPPRKGQRGPELPYTPVAGVVPCPGGWLVAAGRLQGVTLAPAGVHVVARFAEVLDEKPAFQIIAVGAPIGLPDHPSAGGRTCDREARRVLGWPRSGAVLSAPTRRALGAKTYRAAARANGGMSPVVWSLLPRIAELDREIEPYWQRSVYEVHPELSYFQLNGDRPLTLPKHRPEGQQERFDLLVNRVHGIERILDPKPRGAGLAHRLDAAACLWTARRVAARAVSRLPAVPEWDSQGLRMELVR